MATTAVMVTVVVLTATTVKLLLPITQINQLIILMQVENTFN